MRPSPFVIYKMTQKVKLTEKVLAAVVLPTGIISCEGCGQQVLLMQLGHTVDSSLSPQAVPRRNALPMRGLSSTCKDGSNIKACSCGCILKCSNEFQENVFYKRRCSSTSSWPDIETNRTTSRCYVEVRTCWCSATAQDRRTPRCCRGEQR
ncbi:uncharacterized protein LOC144001592 [Festucalex cinctus]